MITQTLAIFADAYRELNARKMFWIVLAISALIVLAFASLGINDRGITFFTVTFNSPLNTRFMTPGLFYKMLFLSLGLLWLAPWASVLAIVSTASIFPDFLTGGSIDLFLAKPISRLRLFFTKYFAGLLFVALQVLVFCFCSFLLIGIRGHEWQAGLFLAVPLVLCYFSYLYCVCVLVGVMTRSTLAAILLTVLFLLFLWGINLTERFLLIETTQEQLDAQRMDQEIKQLQTDIAAWKQATTHPRFFGPTLKDKESRLQEVRRQRADWKPAWHPWHKLSYGIKTVFPKLGETTELLNRWITDAAELRGRREAHPQELRERQRGEPFTPAAAEQAGEEIQSRNVGWVLGTSLLFEAIILSLAAWIFCRRDY